MIEGLPDALGELRSGRSCEIDLYGQGVERTLHFEVLASGVNVRCESRTSWIPVPSVIRCDLAPLIAMLEQLAKDFGTAVTIGAPEFADREPFVQWRQRKT